MSNFSATGTKFSNDELLKRIERSKKLKVALVAVGEMGHITPIVRLACALEEYGHETRVFTNKYQ